MKSMRCFCAVVFIFFSGLTICFAQTDTLTTKEEAERESAFFKIGKNPQLEDADSKKELEYTSVVEETEAGRDEEFLRIGGALRYNLIFTDYENGTYPLGTSLRNDFTMDTWRLNVEGQSKGILLSFEYRFYPTFNTHFIQHGWLGYNFAEYNQLQIGVTQVPFGNLKYASHSWWFQTPYYVGLEDDYDMGIKWSYRDEHWYLIAAYFLLAEPRGTSDPAFGTYNAARYSYDVVAVGDQSNIERNQFNIRLVHDAYAVKTGISLQRTGIFNQVTEHVGNQYAGAAHVDATFGQWNLNAEYIYYHFNDVEDDFGNELDVVQMGAYGFGTYDVAAEASMYVIGLSRSVPVKWGPISNVTLYNDYTYTQKHGSLSMGGQNFEFEPTQQNVFGALLTAGSVYIYVDIASGQNHPWLTDNFGGTDLGIGNLENPDEPLSEANPPEDNPEWNTRFNINIGYYF